MKRARLPPFCFHVRKWVRISARPRASMRNFGLTDLRLIAPRDGWPNERAEAMAAGAADVLERVRIAETADQAASDLTYVFAATARSRELVKPVFTPRQAMMRAREEIGRGGRPGFLFGAEATGLTNEEIACADAILTIPVDPSFSSLNLAQAVAVTAYEWRAGEAAPEGFAGERPAATRQEQAGLEDFLIAVLESVGFFFPPEKTPQMQRNLRNALRRARFTRPEVQSLRGAFKALSEKRRQS